MSSSPAPSRRQALTAAAGLAALPVAGSLGSAFAPSRARADTPMQGAHVPYVYRFPFGAFELTTISDGAITLDGPHPIFGEDRDPDDVQALMRENFLPETRMEIAFTPFLVNTGSELVLFDTGNGDGRRPDAGRLVERLGTAGIEPGQIDVVVLSHFHPDHIGGLMEDGAPAFPNARYAAPRVEYDFWSDPARAEGPTESVGTLVQSNVVPLSEKMTMLEPGDDVVSGITAVEAYGHTPGHMAFMVESDGQQLMFIADTSNHVVASLMRPDWHVRFDMDKEKAVATRRRVFSMAAADRFPVAGFHFPFPAVGYVEEKERGFRYVPVSYQFRV